MSTYTESRADAWTRRAIAHRQRRLHDDVRRPRRLQPGPGATHRARARQASGFTPAAIATWRSFSKQLHTHHTAEDAALWPRLYAAVTDPDEIQILTDMEAEHGSLDPRLEQIDAAIEAARRDRARRRAQVPGPGPLRAHDPRGAGRPAAARTPYRRRQDGRPSARRSATNRAASRARQSIFPGCSTVPPTRPRPRSSNSSRHRPGSSTAASGTRSTAAPNGWPSRWETRPWTTTSGSPTSSRPTDPICVPWPTGCWVGHRGRRRPAGGLDQDHPLQQHHDQQHQRLADDPGRTGLHRHAQDTAVPPREPDRHLAARAAGQHATRPSIPSRPACSRTQSASRCSSFWKAWTPAERLAFVLHDMFGVPFDEIAPIVERTPAATRQLASRARRRVRGHGDRPRRRPAHPAPGRERLPRSLACRRLRGAPPGARPRRRVPRRHRATHLARPGSAHGSHRGRRTRRHPGTAVRQLVRTRPGQRRRRHRARKPAGESSPSSASPSSTNASQRSTSSSTRTNSTASPSTHDPQDQQRPQPTSRTADWRGTRRSSPVEGVVSHWPAGPRTWTGRRQFSNSGSVPFRWVWEPHVPKAARV